MASDKEVAHLRASWLLPAVKSSTMWPSFLAMAMKEQIFLTAGKKKKKKVQFFYILFLCVWWEVLGSTPYGCHPCHQQRQPELPRSMSLPQYLVIVELGVPTFWPTLTPFYLLVVLPNHAFICLTTAMKRQHLVTASKSVMSSPVVLPVACLNTHWTGSVLY